jgi:predicted dehydrogenase
MFPTAPYGVGVLRLGFEGAGLIAWAHVLGIRAMGEAGVVDATVSAVHDVDAGRAGRMAAATGAAAVENTDDLVKACDAVWVCTPTADHAAGVEAAVARGRAVFCEKPLATDLHGATTMTAAVTAARTPAQCGLVLRSTPVFRAVRDLVISGELGRPMTVLFRDDQFFPVQGHYASSWRAEVERAGGGCLIEHSIHDLDILRFCLGEVVEISGRTENFAGHRDVEDLACVSLRFASGARAELVSVWHDILSRGSTRRVEVFFERGLVWLDNEFRGPLHVETSAGIEVRPCPSPPWVDELPLADDDIGLALRLYAEADRAFLDAVAGGRRPEPSFDEALVAHRLVDAVYRSAAAGGLVVASPEGTG